jgi:hypothetical protein
MLSACAIVRPQLALVACPTCSATNFELFRFCQLCGVPRPELALPPHKSVNWSETEQLALSLWQRPRPAGPGSRRVWPYGE